MLAVLVFDGAEARRAPVPEFQLAARRMRSNELARFKRAPEAAAEVGGRPAAAPSSRRFLRSKEPARRTPAAAILVMSDGPPPLPDRGCS